MDLKKRKADFQITPVDTTVNENEDAEQQNEGDSLPNLIAETPVVTSSGFGGFSAYSKINPFAAAMGTNGFKNAFSSSNDTASVFGNRTFGKVSEMAPPLVVPSPKSPKINPFSTPSPKPNPFMTITDSKDDLWQAMAKDKLSADEAAKSCFFNDDKFAPKSTTSASEGQFGSGFGNAVDSKKDNCADEEDGGGEDGEDVERPDSPTFVKYAMPDVAVVTGEEQDQSLLQVRAKLFRLNAAKTTPSEEKQEVVVRARCVAPSSSSSNSLIPSSSSSSSDQTADDVDVAPTKGAAEWVEVGIGPVKLLSRGIVSDAPPSASNSVGRLVMRREEKKGGIGTKLLLNVRLDQFVSVTRQADKVVRLICLNFTDTQSQPPSARPAAALIGEAVDVEEAPATQPAAGVTPSLQTYLLKTKTAQESDDLVAIASDFVTRSKEATQQQASAASGLTQTTDDTSLCEQQQQ